MHVPQFSAHRRAVSPPRLPLTAALFAILLMTAACGSATGAEQIASGGATGNDGGSSADQDSGADSDSGNDIDSAEEDDSGEDTGDGARADGTGSNELPFGLRRCSPDFTVISADPSFYRDEPVYVGNNQPIEELRVWAVDKPAFEEIWVDRDHNGWVSIGFSEGAAARQLELETEFPDYGVVAVEVRHGSDELERLQQEVFAVLEQYLESYSGGHSVPSGQATIYVPVLDEETLAPLADFADRPVCFDGIDPEDAVQDGPQPPEGAGWRLLAVERSGDSYRTGVASNEDQYQRLWQTSQVSAERPEVDFESEIVIWFGAVYGSGCEIRMDDVVFDVEGALVHGDFVVPGNPTSCNADANAEAYLVAVERSAIPAGAFAVQLDAEAPPSGAPEERTLVGADLSQPGSEAADDAIGPDSELINTPDLGYVIGAGGVLEPGFPASYRLELFCDFNVLGPVNGVMWEAVEPVYDGEVRAEVNPAWAAVADDDGVLLAKVLLEEEPPPSLTLSANGHAVEYRPAPSNSVTDCA